MGLFFLLAGAAALFAIGHSFTEDEHDEIRRNPTARKGVQHFLSPTTPVTLTKEEKQEVARNPTARKGLGHFAAAPSAIPAGKVPRVTSAVLSKLRKATGGKDEAPIAPLEDPRHYRAIANAARKKGNAKAAMEADAKADALNVLIRAEKKRRANA